MKTLNKERIPKLTDKMEKIINIYLQRGLGAKKDIDRLAESIWVDYDWMIYKDDCDSLIAVELLSLFDIFVMKEKDQEKACKKAKRMLFLLKGE